MANITRQDLHFLDTERQWNTSRALITAFHFSDFYDTVFGLTTQLLAESLTSGVEQSLPLAPNQWVLEVHNWFTIGLANAQHLLVDYITGPPPQFTPYAMSKTQVDAHPSMAWLCENLVIRRNDFINFSTLSISLVLSFGVLVIGTSCCLESIMGRLRSRRKKAEWRQKAWWTEGTLQLQRRAFEAMGITEWKAGTLDKVPIVENKGKLWSALGHLEEQLPLIEEQVVNEKSPASSSQQSLIASRQGSRMSAPPSSTSEGRVSSGRLRASSV
jgi:hypothetical protein